MSLKISIDINLTQAPVYKYVEELKRLCDKRKMACEYKPGPTHERIYFLLQNSSAAVVGFFTTPDPDRSNNNIAWNRIGKDDYINIQEYHNKVEKDKTIKSVVIQIWTNHNKVIVVSLDELKKSFVYKGTGDFFVERDNDNDRFYLVERQEGNPIFIPDEGLDKVFNYLEK